MTMSAPDPDYILRGTEHSPVNCLEYQEGENYLFSGHQNGSVLVSLYLQTNDRAC